MDQLISDYGSGLYGTFFSSGQILAPIVGSAIYEYIGYRGTTDFMTIVCLTWCLIFFVFNVGFSIFSREKEIHAWAEQQKQERLLKIQAPDNEGTSDNMRMVEQEMDSNGNIKKNDPTSSGKRESELVPKNKNESMMDFINKKRLQWSSELQPGQGMGVNNLSSVFESRNEGTLLESHDESRIVTNVTAYIPPNKERNLSSLEYDLK